MNQKTAPILHICTSETKLEKNAIAFESKHLFFSPVILKDCTDQYLSWLINPKVNQFLETRWTPQSLSTIQAFIQNMLQDPFNLLLAIRDKENGTHIGNIKLGSINPYHYYSDISYFIGNTDYWGQGLGSEAIQCVTQWAIDNIHLVYIYAGCYHSNIASLKALAKAGYKQQGMMHNMYICRNGQRDHLVFMGYSTDPAFQNCH